MDKLSCRENCFLDIVGREKIIPKKTNIFVESDNLTKVYYIKNGIVKIYKITEQGDEKIVDISTVGEFLGLTLALNNVNEYMLNATTITECKFIEISTEDIKRGMDDYNCLKESCTKFAFSKTMQFQSQIAHSLDSNENILNVLNDLHKKFGYIKDNKKVIDMPINKSDLANLIGIRRETLSRKLAKMKEEKILDYNKNKFFLEA